MCVELVFSLIILMPLFYYKIFFFKKVIFIIPYEYQSVKFLSFFFSDEDISIIFKSESDKVVFVLLILREYDKYLICVSEWLGRVGAWFLSRWPRWSAASRRLTPRYPSRALFRNRNFFSKSRRETLCILKVISNSSGPTSRAVNTYG